MKYLCIYTVDRLKLIVPETNDRTLPLCKKAHIQTNLFIVTTLFFRYILQLNNCFFFLSVSIIEICWNTWNIATKVSTHYKQSQRHSIAQYFSRRRMRRRKNTLILYWNIGQENHNCLQYWSKIETNKLTFLWLLLSSIGFALNIYKQKTQFCHLINRSINLISIISFLFHIFILNQKCYLDRY